MASKRKKDPRSKEQHPLFVKLKIDEEPPASYGNNLRIAPSMREFFGKLDKFLQTHAVVRFNGTIEVACKKTGRKGVYYDNDRFKVDFHTEHGFGMLDECSMRITQEANLILGKVLGMTEEREKRTQECYRELRQDEERMAEINKLMESGKYAEESVKANQKRHKDLMAIRRRVLALQRRQGETYRVGTEVKQALLKEINAL